jgi:hypothetical protein
MNKLWFILLLLGTGCATTAQYERNLQSWLGHDVNHLISKWGPPSSDFALSNGNKIYTWVDHGANISYANYSPYANTAIGFTSPTSCKTSFTIDQNGRIIEWRYEGNNCRASK